MRATITVRDAATEHRSDVLIDVEPDAEFASILPRLQTLVGADVSGATASIAVDGRVIDPSASLSATGIRDGSWIDLLPTGQSPRPVTKPATEGTAIRVISGAGTGTVHYAGDGSVRIASDADAAVRVGDSRDVELVLDVAAGGGVSVVSLNGSVTVDGEAVVAGDVLPIGSQIAFENTLLELGEAGAPVAAVEHDPATGAVRFNRPPRVLPEEPDPRFRLPSEPTEPDKAPLPWLMSLIPLVLAVGMVWLFRSPTMLLFGVMTPVMLVGGYFQNRSTSRKRFIRQTAEYVDTKAQIEADAAAALIAERARRRLDYPDAGVLGEIAVTPSPRLWERRPGDPAYLGLRVGTATQASQVSLEDPEQLEHRRTVVWDVRDAPAVVSLVDSGVVGLAGNDDTARDAARWLVAQIGILHSPKDVRLIVLDGVHEADAAGRPWWEFAAWLPHTESRAADAARMIAATTDTIGQRLGELVQLVQLRQETARQNSGSRFAGQAVVVVIDGAQRLRQLPGLVQILREGPAVGVFAICIDRDERLLPEECDTVVAYAKGRATVRRQRKADHASVLPEVVSASWLDWVSRALAPIEDASPSRTDSALPDSARLLDLLNLDASDADSIAAKWTRAPRSTTAILGQGLDGPFAVDIVADGPHGLVGGTTGAGKSELLQTLVASLAVANSPAELNFVLVDYKGGAAFADCAQLPHVVGTVTDLDAHLVGRALASLGAELRRREQLLAAQGAKDLADYLDLVDRRGLPTIPRLVIVIDEFASLARELPDFVSGLVNIAQRGRSLGIHLILATQRPSGVVSPEIRANTTLKIALRVTDSGESSDVIGSPEAATISRTTPGRAYIRLGANSLLPMQTGRVGGRVPTASDAQVAPLVAAIAYEALGAPAPQRTVERSAGDVEVTDLKVLVASISKAAAALAVPQQRQPWLTPLGEQIDLEQIAEPNRIIIGLEDHPDTQSQVAAEFDLDTDGHLYVVGSGRSGRTTALRTIAVSAALAHSAADLHIYGIDFGNGSLLPLTSLPHTGAVIQRHQQEQSARLLSRLRVEIRERQALLATAGVTSLSELRALGGERPAHVLVLLDNWDGFQATFGEINVGVLVDTVRALLREGAAVGIHFVISGDRQLITSSMSTLADRKLMLRMIEKSDYTFAGIKSRDVPDEIPAGRAFEAGSGTELQLAAIAAERPAHEQTARIREIGAELAQRDAAVAPTARPFTVRELPARITRGHIAEQFPLVRLDGRLLVGVGGQDAEPITHDPREHASFVIGGPSRSGRTNALVSMIESGLEQGYRAVLITPRTSALRRLADHPSVVGSITGGSLTEEQLAPHLEGDHEPVIVAIDDAELLKDADADFYLRGALARATDSRVAFVIAGDVDTLNRLFSGWLLDAQKSRRGLLLNPLDPMHGDFANIKIARSEVGQDRPLGRGFATDEYGATVVVHVPDAEVGQ